MQPKENLERACEECIHYWACSRQCGEPMAQSSATGCECYETVKSSMAYYAGTLDGAKGKIPNRLRELAEADKDGRCVVLPCKVGDTVYFALLGRIIEKQVFSIVSFSNSTRIYCGGTSEYFRQEDIGKTFFLTRAEAERALQEMEGKKDGKT